MGEKGRETLDTTKQSWIERRELRGTRREMGNKMEKVEKRDMRDEGREKRKERR